MSSRKPKSSRLENQNIICFSTADWDTLLPTNKHQLMKRFSRRNRVLYLETLGTRAPKLSSGTDLGRIGRRLKRTFQGPVRRSKRLWTLSPLVRPNWASAVTRTFNRQMFSRQIAGARKKFTNPIVWVYSPFAVHLLDQVPEPKAIVYHIVDDLSAVPGADVEAIREAENEMLAKANCVFCTERSLFDRAKLINDNAFFMPNVADFKHFSNPEKGTESDAYELIKNTKGTKVIFSGNITPHKVNLKLFDKLSAEKTDWSFFLIGPVWEGADSSDIIKKLKSKSNVHFTGYVDYHELPACLHLADVLLIPYVRNPATRAVFPLKFFEYLATGKPVVASPLISLLPYRDAVYLAESPKAWLRCIEKSLNDPQRMSEQRQVLARRHTWNHRMREMEDAILSSLE